MHRQCHHLIHYDLPWSLIRIEQRNGRIDRYGQEHQPEFAALILTSGTDGAKDDTTVAEKLLHREEQAHHSLGTAEGITREFTARKEEDRLVKDLLAGKTVDESIDAASAVDDFLADLLAGVGDQPGAAEPPRADVPELFGSTEEFAKEALDFACPALHIDDDGEMLAFKPPDDLVQRLEVLPPNYLKKHNIADRMKVTFDRKLAQRKLDEARQTKTLWPDIAYLSDLHPMIEWLTDKVLLRIARQQAPVLIADVDEPVFLVQGVYSNALGQPTVVQWMAVSGLPDRPRVASLTGTLQQAGVGPGMVNTLQFGDIGRLQELVPAAVRAARAHLEERREDYDRTVDEPLNQYRERVRVWRQDSLLDVPAQFRSPPRAAGRRDRGRARHDDHRPAHGRRAAAAHPGRAGRCPMSYDSLTNRGDYLSPHYLAEVLPRELAKKDGLRARWASGTGSRRPGQGTAGAEARLLRRTPRPRRLRPTGRRRRPGHRGRAPHPRQGRQEAERRCAPRPGFRRFARRGGRGAIG